jgi:hypothetical protein
LRRNGKSYNLSKRQGEQETMVEEQFVPNKTELNVNRTAPTCKSDFIIFRLHKQQLNQRVMENSENVASKQFY